MIQHEEDKTQLNCSLFPKTRNYHVHQEPENILDFVLDERVQSSGTNYLLKLSIKVAKGGWWP